MGNVDDKMDATSTATTSDTTTAATQETESPEHQTTPHPTETPWFGQEDENSKTEEKPAESEKFEGWANFDDMDGDKTGETEEEKLPERAQSYAVDSEEPMKTEEKIEEKPEENKQENEPSKMEVQPMQVTSSSDDKSPQVDCDVMKSSCVDDVTKTPVDVDD